MVDVSALESAVAAQTTVEDSLMTFVQNLKDQLAAELANDPAAQAKVDAVLQEILNNNAKMAAAMQAVP